MKKIYLITALLLTVTLMACSKDFLKKYDRRIVGTWKIEDVRIYGLGGSFDNLPFTEGSISFYEDGRLTFASTTNGNFTGNWDIVKKNVDDETVHSMIITAVNYSTTQSISQYYDDINFTGTDRFKATSVSGFHSYVTIFKR